MIEKLSELQINNAFSFIHPPFKRALCCVKRPQCGYTERSGEGCRGGSVVIGGYRKVVNGVIKIDGRQFTHERLNELNGLYVSVEAKDWLGIEYGVMFVPSIGYLTSISAKNT